MTVKSKKCECGHAAGGLPPAQAISLADQVDYAEGSIISRTIADSKAGTVTLFSFDADQGLSEHSAPYDALVLILDGEAQLKIGGKPVTAKQGQLVVMPANVPHALKAVKRFKMLLTMIRTQR
jgi:quercetin dioxygenase-like cupin family protein